MPGQRRQRRGKWRQRKEGRSLAQVGLFLVVLGPCASCWFGMGWHDAPAMSVFFVFFCFCAQTMQFFGRLKIRTCYGGAWFCSDSPTRGDISPKSAQFLQR